MFGSCWMAKNPLNLNFWLHFDKNVITFIEKSERTAKKHEYTHACTDTYTQSTSQYTKTTSICVCVWEKKGYWKNTNTRFLFALYFLSIFTINALAPNCVFYFFLFSRVFSSHIIRYCFSHLVRFVVNDIRKWAIYCVAWYWANIGKKWPERREREKNHQKSKSSMCQILAHLHGYWT